MKSAKAIFGAPAVFCDCWRRVKKFVVCSLLFIVCRTSISSSLMVFAGKIPRIPLAVNHFSDTIWFSIFWASANNEVACSPTTSSVKIAGYFPYNSHELKNGVQSIKSTNSESSTATVLVPIKFGFTGWKLSQSNFSLFLRASSIDK